MNFEKELSPSKADKTQVIQDLFARADVLLFKDRKYFEAEALYNQILEMEKDS
jgi:hypothetical protein